MLETYALYYYWAFLEFTFFFAYIISIVLHVAFHMLSPFKAYMYYSQMAVNDFGGHEEIVWGN